jgi:hypothetical protein
MGQGLAYTVKLERFALLAISIYRLYAYLEQAKSVLTTDGVGEATPLVQPIHLNALDYNKLCAHSGIVLTA